MPLSYSTHAHGEPADQSRVLIVDDSAVMRAVLTRMIDASQRFVVAHAVANADAAITFLKQARVDAVILDIEMPGVDGLTALPDLIVAGQGAPVIVVSSAASEGAAATIQALALGAADTLAKPAPAAGSGVFAEALVTRLDRLVERRPSGLVTPPPVSLRPAPPRLSGSRPGSYDIVAIGASTGGIHALGQLFRELPASFTLPVLVTQHLPPTFMPYFAAQVAVLAGRPCDVAVDRMRIMPGRVVLAPGDAHIRVTAIRDGGASIRLSREPVANGCMPSVDPMFETLAEVYGDRALAVVLSGMGRDGSSGARLVHAAGGCVIAQDRASSVVWGMPGAVASAGFADAMLAPDAIGALVAAGRRP